eukprot:1154238-Pelagomonas_calceolata.AAC.5
MARDMVHLLDATNRFRARYDAMHYIGKAQRAAAAPAAKQVHWQEAPFTALSCGYSCNTLSFLKKAAMLHGSYGRQCSHFC